MKQRRQLRPRPFEYKRKLTVIHDPAGLEPGETAVARSIATRNLELEKNNDKVLPLILQSQKRFFPGCDGRCQKWRRNCSRSGISSCCVL